VGPKGDFKSKAKALPYKIYL